MSVAGGAPCEHGECGIYEKAPWESTMVAASERLGLPFRSHTVTAGCGEERMGGSAGGLDQSQVSAIEGRKQP